MPPDPEQGPRKPQGFSPSSADSPLARVVCQMAPPPRKPMTVGTSSCLPGLAANVLSKAELPFWARGWGYSQSPPHKSL